MDTNMMPCRLPPFSSLAHILWLVAKIPTKVIRSRSRVGLVNVTSEIRNLPRFNWLLVFQLQENKQQTNVVQCARYWKSIQLTADLHWKVLILATAMDIHRPTFIYMHIDTGTIDYPRVEFGGPHRPTKALWHCDNASGQNPLSCSCNCYCV